MSSMVNRSATEISELIEEYERPLQSDDSRDPGRTEDTSVKGSLISRLLPFGSGMIPTAGARGALLEKATLADLNRGSMKLFEREKKILGHRNNVGVSINVRNLEDQNQQYLTLQAKVLQLRNQLYRQRRIRILNEKTYNATKERAARVESLVTEMRTDLKTLKGRLDDEIRELGISEENAESILTSYYSSLDVQSGGESPHARRRRVAEVEGDHSLDSEKMIVETKKV